MQALFKNTPTTCFTERRQAIFSQALEVINQTPELISLNPNASCLAELIPKLGIHHKALMPLLFNSLDLLWALHSDGCNILDEINRLGGFLYDYPRTDGEDFENIESPSITLKYDGFQAIALGLNGVVPEQKGKALRDLIPALAGINPDKFKRDLPKEYEVNLFLNIECSQGNPLSFDYKSTLAYQYRFNEDEKRKLGYMIHGYIEYLKSEDNEISGYGTIGSKLISAYCYSYACQMKMNEMANLDIIYNLETVIAYLIEALGVCSENIFTYSRILLVNACTPFIDLLGEIDTKDYELSAGLCLPRIIDEPAIKILSRHNSGAVFMPEHIRFMHGMIETLENKGYGLKLDYAIKNPLATTQALSALIKKEPADSMLIDSVLEEDEVPLNLYRAIMESAEYAGVSTRGLANLFVNACKNYEMKAGDTVEKTAHGNFRLKIFKRETEKEIKKIIDFIGDNWKEKILPIMDEMGRIDRFAVDALGIESADIKLIRNASQDIKRYILEKEIGLNL